jgi:TctA family transporter
MNADNARYIPGTCNIGKEEIEQRKKPAIILFVIFIAAIVVLKLFTSNHLWRLLIFFPAAGFGISFLQWYLKFCVAFGLKGIYNFDQVGKTVAVAQDENLKKDKAKVRQMVVVGVLFGIVSAIVYYFLPF